jgi:8-oxo-dGTP diphosphatase
MKSKLESKTLQKRALEILVKDKLQNCNIINFMEQYSIDRVDIKGESVLVRGESDDTWTYISSENKASIPFSILKRTMRNL